MHEKEPTANRRKSALRARRIGFAYPHSRSSCLVANQRFAPLRASLFANLRFALRLGSTTLSCRLTPLETPARPFIGTVRANPVAAPAALVREMLIDHC